MKQIRLLLTGWSHVTCLMSNANVDPWDMLKNFCFHVYAQNSLFMGENDNGCDNPWLGEKLQVIMQK